jgi:hypothetical protein
MMTVIKVSFLSDYHLRVVPIYITESHVVKLELQVKL